MSIYRDWLRRASGRINSAMVEVAEELEDTWPFFLAYGIIVSVLLGGVLQLLYLWYEHISSLPLKALVLIPCLMLTVAAVAVGLWAYANSKRRPDDARSYVVTLATWALVIIFSVQFFAALTLGLGAHHVIAVGTSSLWTTERFYLFTFADSIPFLDVLGTVHWHEPVIVTGHLGGGLLLVFKTLVLVPTLAMLVATVRFVVDERQRADRRERDRYHKPVTARSEISARAERSFRRDALLESLQHLACYSAVALAGFGIIGIASRRGSIGSLIVGGLPARIYIGGTLSLSRGQQEVFIAAACLLGYGVLLWRTGGFIRRNLTLNREDRGPAAFIAEALVAAVHVFAVMELTGGIVLLLQTSTTTVPDMLNALAWQSARMIPTLNLVGTLEWHSTVRFDDVAAAWSLLLFKVAVVIVLPIPVYQTIQAVTGWLNTRRSKPSLALRPVHDFGVALDALERQLPELSATPAVALAYWPLWRLVDALDATVVAQAFGPSDAYQAAWRAANASREYLYAIRSQDKAARPAASVRAAASLLAPKPPDLKAAAAEFTAAKSAYYAALLATLTNTFQTAADNQTSKPTPQNPA